MSDSGDKAVINVKIYTPQSATKQNTNKLELSVINDFEHQGPKVVHVLRKMTVGIF